MDDHILAKAKDEMSSQKNILIPIKEPQQNSFHEILGMICSLGTIYVFCRGEHPGEPGKLLIFSPAHSWQSGWKVTLEDDDGDSQLDFYIRYFGREIGTAQLDLSWQEIYKQVTSEIKNLRPNSKCVLAQGEDDKNYLQDKMISASSNLKFLRYAPWPLEADDESMEYTWAGQVESMYKAYLNLELIELVYGIRESAEQSKRYVPFLTPEEILSEKPTKGKGPPHNRFLWIVTEILVNMQHLKRMSVTFGGGKWTYHQQRTWQDFVDEMLEEGSRQDMVKQLKRMMGEASSEAFENGNSQEMEEDCKMMED